MKLTVENNRERIKRFGHIKAAPIWGAPRCSETCPGSARACKRKRGHTGPHVAHGTFNRVLAVWDGDVGMAVRSSARKPRRSAGALERKSVWENGPAAAIRALWRRGLRRVPSLEEGFLFILALTMVGFAVDMALRILGWR